MKKVVKFGGSSLADASQFQKVAKIIKSDPARIYVVPSAPGKRFDSDTKVTDMLYALDREISAGKDCTEIFGAVKQRYNEIIKELELNFSLDAEFDKIFTDIKNGAGTDYSASRGEYLNGMILAEYIGFTFVDPAGAIIFDDDGRYNDKATMTALASKLSGLANAVIPGFYGSMDDGRIKTFSRGGSDITGSIVAKAVKADIYENWTDVSGFLVADPRIVKNPEVIEQITYRELRELSYMGAGVLHEDAIFPVRTAGIPINIKNTNKPEDKGTLIVAHQNTPFNAAKSVITGIAGKKGFCAISIEKDMMNNEYGFGRKVLEILENHKISFEHLPSGIDTMSIIVNSKEINGKEEHILARIREEVQPDHIELEQGIALLAVVGRGMRKVRGTAARIFAALAHANINIKMIDQGSSELNIIIGIDDEDFEKAINVIYEMFMLSV